MFDGPTLAKIFMGDIKSWDDPAIAKLNPGIKLPSAGIAVVHRSDGSGTTFNFTDYLSKVSADWKSKVGEATAVKWPTGLGAKGNEGVAANVKQTGNSIGYVEYAYAMQNKLTYGDMINHDGQKVAPVSESFAAAAANADWKGAPGFYLLLTDQTGAKSWPITASTLHPDADRADRPCRCHRGTQVLRLGLRERRRGREVARLHPDAEGRRRPRQAGVGGADQGHRR